MPVSSLAPVCCSVLQCAAVSGCMDAVQRPKASSSTTDAQLPLPVHVSTCRHHTLRCLDAYASVMLRR